MVLASLPLQFLAFCGSVMLKYWASEVCELKVGDRRDVDEKMVNNISNLSPNFISIIDVTQKWSSELRFLF